MDELKQEGPGLKKLVNLGRRGPMPFAFCPGAGEDGPSLAVHRRKKPDIMGKTLRKEEGQSKVAFGTFTVEQKTITMTCSRVVPGMSKKLKKYLRSQKLPMDIVLLDKDGNEVTG